MKKITLIFWIIEVAICFVLGSIYVVTQQNIRQSANDLPTVMAKDAVDAIKHSLSSESDFWTLVPTKNIELSRSISPFLYITKSDGAKNNSDISNASLDEKTLSFPLGIFSYAKDHGVDKVTWQPKNGVREAIVVMPYSFSNGVTSFDGFVIAGQSLTEYENRIEKIGKTCLVLLLLGTIGNILTLFTLTKYKVLNLK